MANEKQGAQASAASGKIMVEVMHGNVLHNADPAKPAKPGDYIKPAKVGDVIEVSQADAEVLVANKVGRLVG